MGKVFSLLLFDLLFYYFQKIMENDVSSLLEENTKLKVHNIINCYAFYSGILGPSVFKYYFLKDMEKSFK